MIRPICRPRWTPPGNPGSDFISCAFDQIINSAAHIRYMFGGQVTVPLVIRVPQGAGHQLGPTHSHCLEAMFLHVPGLLVAVPATPADASKRSFGLN